MRAIGLIAASLFSLTPVAAAPDLLVTLGPGEGAAVPSPAEPPCDGVLLEHGDGSWEYAYAWRNESVALPDFGGFGEGYTATGSVCGMRAYLTTTPGHGDFGYMNALVYDSDGTNPGNVLSVTVDILVEQLSFWPEVSIREFEVTPTDVDGEFFVYLWPNWPGAWERWYFAVDRTGLPGLPRTKIVPGFGYPSGWQNPNVAFGPTKAMGVGAYVEEGPSPVASASWSQIKSLFR